MPILFRQHLIKHPELNGFSTIYYLLLIIYKSLMTAAQSFENRSKCEATKEIMDVLKLENDV